MTEMNFDAIAEKCLETYNNGEYAYEDGAKTIEQRQLKHEIKTIFTTLFEETNGKKKKSLQAIASFCQQPDNAIRIRQDLRKARLEVTRLKSLTETQKAYYENIYKQEMYAQYKFERDEELVDEMKKQSSRFRELHATCDRLYDENRYLKEHSKNQDEYDSLKVHCDILEKEIDDINKKKSGKSNTTDTKKLLKQMKKKDKEIEYLKYQLKSKDDTDSDSSDDED